MTSLQLKFWRLHEVCDVSKNLHFTWSKASIHEGPNVCLCGAPLKVLVTWSYNMNQCILSDTHSQKSVLSISILWRISHTHQQLRKQYVYSMWWSMKWIFAYDWHGKWISGSSFLCHEIEQWPRAAGDLLYIGDEILPRQIGPDYFMSHARY